MNTHKFRMISMLLVIIFAVSLVPFNRVGAAPVLVGNMTLDVTDDLNQNIIPGDKNVDFNLWDINIGIDSNFDLVSPTLLNNIRVTANGSIDETYKFDITYSSSSGKQLRLHIKGSDTSIENPYQLIKQALYNIYIPQGTFRHSDGVTVNNPINYSFVTNTDDGGYSGDILKSTMPSNSQHDVDYKNGRVEFEFADDISVAADDLSNPANLVVVSSSALSLNMKQASDAASNYIAGVSGNKLVLQSKTGTFNDFAHYTFTLKAGIVSLRDNPSSVPIINNAHKIEFYTDNMLESSSPANNQENVSVEPTIEFKFKHELLEPINISNIALSSEGADYPLTSSSIVLSDDKKSLKIIADDGANNPLRKNTLYKATIRSGTLRFRDYNEIVNRTIDLYFITGGAGEVDGPKIAGYSSNTGRTDDITDLSSTRLDSMGSIYVHFDRPIREDAASSASGSLLNEVELYKIPRAQETNYDPLGKICDKNISFQKAAYGDAYGIIPASVSAADFGNNGYYSLEDEGNLEEVLVGKVEIIQPNMLRITPAAPLQNLSKYEVFLWNDLIEDTNGYNMESPVEFSFWTGASSTAEVPVWESVASTQANEILENQHVPYRSYTLHGTPQYGPGNAIICNIDHEVIVRAQDKTVIETPKLVKKVSFDALQEISLEDVLNTDTTANKVGFSKYELEYYYENGVKKTKLSLYPESLLENGKQYRLTVPSGVFESRSGHDLGRLEVNFTVEGSDSGGRGIYTLENQKIKAADLKGTGEWTFYINGYNFTEAIDGITLNRTSGTGSLTSVNIAKEDIFFESVTRLRVKIRGDAAQDLSDESSAGTYRVSVDFHTGADCDSPADLEILAKGKPEVIAEYPSGSGQFDENALLPQTIDGTKRYFIRVAFRYNDGSLVFNSASGLSTLRDSCTVFAQGSGVSLIDNDFLTTIMNMTDVNQRQSYIDNYLFTKDVARREAYLNIPIKLLRPQTTYNVKIQPGVVKFSDISDEAAASNELITWDFNTIATPYVKGISMASVSENYDEDIPIIITGEFFYDSTLRVYFNKTEAEDVNVKTDADGKQYLEVYLPSGSDRLEPGVYNITVENDASHQRIEYGSFSVVKAAEGEAPNGDHKVKAENNKGKVVSDIKVSQDTLELKSGYNNDSHVELNLDELMGEEVLVRRIKINGRYGNRIGELETKSKWADISVYGLTVESSSDNKKIELNLGRVEPALVQTLKSKFKGRAFKSDFIQATGSNFKWDKVVLGIPVKNTEGSNLKVIRYDEERREWFEQNFTWDRINGRIIVESSLPGIFVVVE